MVAPREKDDYEQHPFATRAERKLARRAHRRAKIVSEIQRNRRGEFTVPTWVLVALLAAIVGAMLTLVIVG